VANQIKIRVLETGKLAIATVGGKDDCILGTGSRLPRSAFQFLGTMACCACGSIGKLLKKDTWYGPRLACPSCEPPKNYAICVYCNRHASDRITRRYHGKVYTMYYCHVHLREAAGYDPSRDLVAEIPVAELEAKYQEWIAGGMKPQLVRAS
jgi:hypothetical protein